MGKISALRVVSRTSAMSYKGSGKTVPQIAGELDIDAVIEGTVFPAGDSVRIQVQLIGARPERHLWAQAYQRDVRNVVAVLGEVASTIAEQIKVTLTPREAARRAMQLDPLSLGLRLGYSGTAWTARDHQTQHEQAHTVRVLNPDLELAWWSEALSLLALGRPAECVELARVPAGPKAMCLYALRRTVEATRTIEALIARGVVRRSWSDDVMLNAVYYCGWTAQLGEP